MVLLIVSVVLLVRMTRTQDQYGVGVLGRLQGISWLLRRLDIGGVGSDTAALALVQRGAELEKEARYREALSAYEQAYELSADEIEVYLGMARAHEALGAWEVALADLEEAAQIAPENAEVQRHLGRLQCLRGDYTTCIETLERAVEMEPDDSMGRFWLALAYQNDAETDLNRALSEYAEALKIDPDLAKAHLALGDLYADRPGREAIAVEAYTYALGLAVEQGDAELASEASSALARLYYAQDDYSLCIEEAKKVLAADPDDPDAHRRLGLCYGMRGGQGDLEQALVHLEEALRGQFLNLDAYYFYLGQYYAERQDLARAVWSWEQFLRFSENEEMNAQVRQFLAQVE